jgi:hemerythrin-like metal-binding protein
MPIIAWSNMLSVGVKDIDEQHRKLIEIMNRLNDSLEQHSEGAVEKRTLEELVNYTIFHFGFEEKLMKENGLTGMEIHFREHGNFISLINQKMEQYNRGENVSGKEIMIFLWDWLTSHILNVDRNLGEALNTSGVR